MYLKVVLFPLHTQQHSKTLLPGPLKQPPSQELLQILAIGLFLIQILAQFLLGGQDDPWGGGPIVAQSTAMITTSNSFTMLLECDIVIIASRKSNKIQLTSLV